MSRKTINPIIDLINTLNYGHRYIRYICTIKQISMSEAMAEFGYRYRILYSKKLFLET